ncbi:MAG: hypothetical protein Ct9H300mP15_09020 [Gemmatimonadota bacterium]|nr:MAG: hypothetical protein Ct9H300mP15_09020 [Gemmatimonadota bacterium]
MVSELGGERIDIVPWHPDTDVFARRALAPARVSKVISDTKRAGYYCDCRRRPALLGDWAKWAKVRLASQLFGWQIDLYGSREWVEKGADISVLKLSLRNNTRLQISLI